MSHANSVLNFVVGRSGSGKSKLIHSKLVAAASARDKSILIFDLGRTHYSAAMLFGGAVRAFDLKADFELNVTSNFMHLVDFQFDDTPITLVDQIADEQLPDVFIIDEGWYFNRYLQGVGQFCQRVLDHGGEVCITLQSEDDVMPFSDLVATHREITRTSPIKHVAAPRFASLQ